MGLGLLLASFSPHIRCISSRSPFTLFSRVHLHAFFSCLVPLEYLASCFDLFPFKCSRLPLLSSSHQLLSLLPALRAHSHGHLSPPRMVLRAIPGPLGHIATTLARTQGQGTSSTSIIILTTPFHLLSRTFLPDSLPLKVFRPWLFDTSPRLLRYLIRSLPNPR